jgi:hypothetical protein
MASSQSRLPIAITSLVAFVAVVIVNALATTIPLGGMTTGQLSDLYPNLFVPAGITFAIWGVIYVLLGLYVVYNLIVSARASDESSASMSRIGLLFLLSCAANAGWIFSWQYRVLPLSLVCMLILLASLIMIYVGLNVGRSQAGSAQRYMVHLPFSIYLGWISIATIANVTALLVYYKWDRFGISEQVWAIVMIAVGVALGLLVLLYRTDIFYALVVDWAVLGILLKRTAAEGGAAQGVIVASWIAIGVLTLGILVQVARRKVYR